MTPTLLHRIIDAAGHDNPYTLKVITDAQTITEGTFISIMGPESLQSPSALLELNVEFPPFTDKHIHTYIDVERIVAVAVIPI